MQPEDAAELVEVDFTGPDDVPLTTSETRTRLAVQDRLDIELGAYWSSRSRPPTGTAGQRRLEVVSNALDASTLPMYVLGPDGTYLGANQAFLDLAQRRLDEVVGRSPATVWADRRAVPTTVTERQVDLPGVGKAVLGSPGRRSTHLGQPRSRRPARRATR